VVAVEAAAERGDDIGRRAAGTELRRRFEGEHDARVGVVELGARDQPRPPRGIVQERAPLIVESLEHYEVVEVPEEDGRER
jgi:hypothetical protein